MRKNKQKNRAGITSSGLTAWVFFAGLTIVVERLSASDTGAIVTGFLLFW
jgi:hypothetical protein